MKKLIFPVAIAATLVLSAFTAVSSSNWKIADGYSIKFSSKDPSGVFNTLKGDIAFDENNLAASRFDVTVDVASINTGNGMQNKHAKSSKWFDAATYPVIRFTSDKISKTASGYEASGTLNMHGVSKPLVIPFTFSNKTFTGTFTVNRLDYKIGTTEGSSAKTSTDIKLDISVPVTQ